MTQLTQHQAKVLQALIDAGPRGLNSYSAFRKDHALQISGTINELKAKGYMIKSARSKGDRSATYHLLHTPLHLKNAPQATTGPSRGIPAASEKPRQVTPLEIEQKKQALREEWKSANSERREAILLEVKPLDAALRAIERRAQKAN